MTVLYVLLAVIAFFVLLTAVELVRLLKIKPLPDSPEDSQREKYSLNVNGKSFEDLYLFLCGKQSEPSFSEDEVYALLSKQADYMNRRFDCADFRAQLLFKIYKDCAEKLNPECKALIKNTFLNFKYSMDEPGDDSMCYWSENHQLLFAVSEYLAAQEWSGEIFTNDGKSAEEHREKALGKIQGWMKQRFDYGFSEYLSNNYLAEDIAPMANFIAYSADEKEVSRMKIIMDILWLDVALNSVNNRFVAVSSRIPFFFGVATKFEEMARMSDAEPIRIVRMRKVSFIDATGLHNLEIFITASQKQGQQVILSGVNESVYREIERGGLLEMVGRENVLDHIHKAIKRAEELSKEIKG